MCITLYNLFLIFDCFGKMCSYGATTEFGKTVQDVTGVEARFIFVQVQIGPLIQVDI